MAATVLSGMARRLTYGLTVPRKLNAWHNGDRHMNTALFVQAPPPRFSFQDAPSNIPLAAGFLLSTLNALGPKEIDAHILEGDIADVFADQGLIEQIAARTPTLLALTLYVWNVQRSLFVASQVKQRLPELRVLVGGPEVTVDNLWLMQHPAVDAGVFGEGESRISRVMEALTAGQSIESVPGTFGKSAGRLSMNGDSAPPWDLASCPYPYLDGTIGPSREGLLFLETVRGCPFRCRYCHYYKAFQNIKVHPRESVQAVLDLAFRGDSGIKEIYLMDPTFNARRGFRDLLKSIAARRMGGSPVIHTELRADFLTREDVALLRDAGLASAEVGLQTINPVALRLAGRDGDPDKTARGVELLKEADVEVTTGIIVGLPGDTPEGFSATLEWLKRTQAYSVVHPFVLSILPGTDFRKRASELGLKYDSRPPYHVLSTVTFPQNAVRHALEECEAAFQMELDSIAPPLLVDGGPRIVQSIDDATYVSTWIVDPTRFEWISLLPKVILKATNPFTFRFRGIGGSRSEKPAVQILGAFAQANPHAVVHVVVEFREPPGLSFFDNALAVAAHPGVYVNRAYGPLRSEGEAVSPTFWILWPDPGDSGRRAEIREHYHGRAEVVWELAEMDERRLSLAEPPLLLSWSLSAPPRDWKPLLELLKTEHSDHPEQVLFRDWRIQEVWNALTRREAHSRGLSEAILDTA